MNDETRQRAQFLEALLEDELTSAITRPCNACDATAARNRFNRGIVTHESECPGE